MPDRPVRATASSSARVPLATIAREWTRIGCVGFGGPPAHVALFRTLCVEQRGWLTDDAFEDAVATTSLLPGPGSTQLAIYCAWRLGGVRGALAGGAGFILPGLIVILGLSALFLAGSPPAWIVGAGAGAGAAVAAVALQAGTALLLPGWRRTSGARRWRWATYVAVGVIATPLIGAWLVLALLGCGVVELAWRRRAPLAPLSSLHPLPLGIVAAAVGAGGLGALAWTAFKVGALSYGGGFVIIPLMRADAVGHHHWMTSAQFLDAVALGQVTPGPVVHTVAAVGFAAAGVGGGLLAAAVAFAPSFSFILIGARRFDDLRADERVRAFLDGAAPAAIGAIVGSAIPLASSLQQPWQVGVLAAAAIALLALRRGVVGTLLLAGVAGTIAALAGAPLPV